MVKGTWELTRLRGGRALRTDSVVGVLRAYPALGEPLVLQGAGLMRGVRLVVTSPIVRFIRTKGWYKFETQSGSHYKLEEVKSEKAS